MMDWPCHRYEIVPSIDVFSKKKMGIFHEILLLILAQRRVDEFLEPLREHAQLALLGLGKRAGAS